MTKYVVLLLCLFFSFPLAHAQEETNGEALNERYLEDQFYASLGYNFVLEKPEVVIQRNLSYNLQLGFIKDIPFNQKRNFGIGLGFGYAANSYYTNLLALETGPGVVNYRLANSDETINRSKLETHAIEFPFEIRWRTSNAVEYKFWRVYGGFKMSYLFSRKSILSAENIADFEGNSSFSNPTIQQWQYGFMLNFGYNTWNLHVYYALSTLLDENALFEGEQLQFRPLRIGVIFYIL